MTRPAFVRNIFLVMGLAAIGYAGFGYASETVWQAWHKRDFERTLALRAPAAPGVEPAQGGPLSGKLEIARLGIDAMVSEGDDDRTLALAVGHIPSTGLPGRAGNVGLAAHRDRLFRNLRDIRQNDRIVLSTISGDYVYSVAWSKIVRPSDVSVLAPTAGEETLTLVTCYPFYFVGDAPFRFIVRARRTASGI